MWLLSQLFTLTFRSRPNTLNSLTRRKSTHCSP